MSKKDEETLFPKKWNKVIAQLPEFKDTADAASEEDLKKIIVSCEGNIYTIDHEKDSVIGVFITLEDAKAFILAKEAMEVVQ
mgnify:CR=1 FL=1